ASRTPQATAVPLPSENAAAAILFRSPGGGCFPLDDGTPQVPGSPTQLGRLVELGEVPAQERAGALLHLPHAFARQAPLLADLLEEAVVALLHQILEPNAAAHELARDGDHEAQVVDDELLLRAPLAFPRTPRHRELRLPVERGMGTDQLDERSEIVELATVAH